MSRITTLLNFIPKRNISVTRCLEGKKNFRKFVLASKRGTKMFKKKQATDPDPDIPIDNRGTRPTGYVYGGRFIHVPEMTPELIVPDLKDFKLKPYVSYKAPDVVQSEFTAEQLFNIVYASKIVSDYKSGKLNADGDPLAPSPEEQLTSEEALLMARKTGSDIF